MNSDENRLEAPNNTRSQGHTRRKLEKLRESTNADSLSDVIRHALELYNFVVAREHARGAVVLREGSEETRLLRL
jgi:hypothetical protein